MPNLNLLCLISLLASNLFNPLSEFETVGNLSAGTEMSRVMNGGRGDEQRAQVKVMNLNGLSFGLSLFTSLQSARKTYGKKPIKLDL